MASSVLATLSSAASDMACLEEALIIAAIGIAFIVLHKLGVAPAQRPAKLCKLAIPEEEEEEYDEGGSCGGNDRARPSLARRAREPERRAETGSTRAPPTSVVVPGVTDQRFVGHIVSYKEEDGYGFISCPELYPRFQRDVFLHRLQIGAFEVGSTVSFGVFLNKSGQPQARDLETADSLPNASTWEGWNVSARPFEPLQRQPLNPHAKPFETLMEGASAAPSVAETAKAAPRWKRAAPYWDEWGNPAQDMQEGKWTCEKQYGVKGKPRWVPKKAAAAAEQ